MKGQGHTYTQNLESDIFAFIFSVHPKQDGHFKIRDMTLSNRKILNLLLYSHKFKSFESLTRQDYFLSTTLRNGVLYKPTV